LYHYFAQKKQLKNLQKNYTKPEGLDLDKSSEVLLIFAVFFYLLAYQYVVIVLELMLY